MRHGSLDEIKPKAFEELLKTNLFGTWLVTTQALKRLAEKPTVLLVSSERALYPRKDVGGYGFIKQATMELMIAIQEEHPWINLKIAFPGPVNTGPQMIDPARLESMKDITLTPEKMARHLKRFIASSFSILLFEDPRESKSFTGMYVMENLRGSDDRVVLD